MTEWKQIMGTEYEVSFRGEVRETASRDILPTQISPEDGIDKVVLGGEIYDVSRLVLITFHRKVVGDRFDDSLGDVLEWADGDRGNNYSANVRWANGCAIQWKYTKRRIDGKLDARVVKMIEETIEPDAAKFGCTEGEVLYIQSRCHDQQRTQEEGFLVHGPVSQTFGGEDFPAHVDKEAQKLKIYAVVERNMAAKAAMADARSMCSQEGGAARAKRDLEIQKAKDDHDGRLKASRAKRDLEIQKAKDDHDGRLKDYTAEATQEVILAKEALEALAQEMGVTTAKLWGYAGLIPHRS